MGISDIMQWEQDLIKDIRVHTDHDNQDPPRLWPRAVGYGEEQIPVQFSSCNQEKLIESFNNVKNECKCILEIGVHRPLTVQEEELSSTECLINNKNEETIYLGVDTEDRSFIDNVEQNIYTIQTSSSNYQAVIKKLEELGQTCINYLFLDGWHSINQILQDWEYTQILAPYGIVGFHDVAFHPGPMRFVQALDRFKWNVELYCFDTVQTSHLIDVDILSKNKHYYNTHGETRPIGHDYGIAFAQRKF